MYLHCLRMRAFLFAFQFSKRNETKLMTHTFFKNWISLCKNLTCSPLSYWDCLNVTITMRKIAKLLNYLSLFGGSKIDDASGKCPLFESDRPILWKHENAKYLKEATKITIVYIVVLKRNSIFAIVKWSSIVSEVLSLRSEFDLFAGHLHF